MATKLKVVAVVPLGAPLDSGIAAAGTANIADGASNSGRTTAEGAVIQSLNALLMQVENAAYAACGSAIATTTSKVKTVNTCPFTIDGVWYSLSGTDNFWTLTGTAVTAATGGATMHYALCVNSSGTASVVQGPTNQGSTTVWTPAPANLLPIDIAVIATLKISLTATTVFTPGTTALSAAGVTATYEDGMDATLWGAYQISPSLI